MMIHCRLPSEPGSISKSLDYDPWWLQDKTNNPVNDANWYLTPASEAVSDTFFEVDVQLVENHTATVLLAYVPAV